MRAVYFSEAHDQFRKTVRLFAEQELAPHADEWERQRAIPRHVWRRMGELGFLGVVLPEAYGGTAADIFYALCLLEELPRSTLGGLCAAVSVQQFIVSGAVHRLGSEVQRQRYLAGSIAGDLVGAICITEPDAGSDVGALRTTADWDGSGYVISGAKTFITNGVSGDFYLVAAKTDKTAGTKGISLFVVDAGTSGISARALEKIGWHCSDTAEVHFDAVRVPAANLIGSENLGFYAIAETFTLERLLTAAISIGSCQAAIEMTVAYMQSRQAFGAPISRLQALRHRMADLVAELDAVRHLVYHTAWLYQQGDSAVREAAQAKLLATELHKRVLDECLQFHGGYGYMEEYPIARMYRDARVTTIVAGTSEIMREIIAKVAIDGASFPRLGDRVRPSGSGA